MSKYEPREFWALIPKGTEILKGNPHMGDPPVVEKTTRAIRAKVSTGVRIYKSGYPTVNAYLGGATYNENRCSFGDQLGTWGEHDRYQYVDTTKIQEVEAPKKAERTDTGPTMTQLLQPGSKWKLTEPAPLDIGKRVQQTNERNYEWIEVHYVPNGELPVGTEFTVVTKPAAAASWRVKGRTGLYVDVDVMGKPHTLKVTDLKNAEPLQEAEAQPVFVIQDSVTGLFYKAPEYCMNDKGVWTHTKYTMVERFPGARKWKRLSDVRTSLLDITGYYDGLPDSGNLPDWMGGKAQIEYKDIPRTWRIAKVNKLTKTVMDTVELVDTLDRSWRLRDLTVKYGSGVRSTYSSLEKNDKIKEFSGMLIFTVGEAKRKKWWDNGMTDEQKAEIDEALQALDKKDIKRGKGFSDYAIAVKDIDTAVMIKLQYSGELNCHLVDLQSLQEVVK